MSASDADQVHIPVLVATDPVISHKVPVPVDGQILKDVSNLGSIEMPESVGAGLVTLNKTDASNGAAGHTSRKSLMKTSADEKENPPSYEQPASVEGGIFVDDKEVIIHGSDIGVKETKDVQDAPVVEADSAESDSITTDNVDDTTLNEQDNETIAVKDIPNTSEVESIAAVEHGTTADSDLTAPVAKIIEANTIDDSVNDSAIENPLPVLERKEGCAKDNEDDAAPADDVKLAETGNHNEAVQMDKRDTTDNVDDTPGIMNEAPNGETLAIAEVALQEKGNPVNVDVASSTAEGDALDIDVVPETNASIAIVEAPELNVTDNILAQVDAADANMKDNLSSDHVEFASAASEAVVENQENVPKVTVPAIVEPTQNQDAPVSAEEHVPVIEAAPTEADLKGDEAVVATETEIAVESNGTGVTTEDTEESRVDEISTEVTNNLDAVPLVEEVEVGHEVEPAAEDANDIEEASRHEEPVRSAVEEEPEAAVRVVEEIPDAVVVDETTEALDTVKESANDAEASISASVEVEPISSEANIAPEVEVTCEGRPAPEVEQVANETTAAPVDAGAAVEAEPSNEKMSAPVEGESVPANDAVYEAASVTVEEDVVPASTVVMAPVIENEECAGNVEDIVTETTNEEVSAEVEVEPATANEEVIAAPVGESVTTEAAAKVVNESEEVAQTSDESGAAAPETNVETYEEAPVTIEVQHVDKIDEEANEATLSVLAKSIAETEGHDVVTQEAPGSLVEPDSIPTSDEVVATVVEVAEEPILAPIESTFATTENNALDETTVVEAETAPIEVPVEVAVAAEGDSEPSVPGEEFTPTIPAAAAPQAEEEVIHAEASTPVETELVTVSGDIATPSAQVPVEAATPSIHVPDADNDVVVEAQVTHTEEIALDTKPSTAVAEGEAIASVPVAESDLQPDEGASVEEISSAKVVGEAIIEETTVIEIQQPQPTDVSELAEKEVIDIGSTDVPVTEAVVGVEESTSTPVIESVPEHVPELRAGVMSIETSLDTTPFTPVLDSGIEFKEQESAPSTLSSIAEDFERPKSSWEPSSFQVFTVGGVESSGVSDAEPVPESTEPAETGESASVPLLVVEDKQVPAIDTSEDFVSVDQPSSEQPPGPWTPSYSVHSQGSPTSVELAEDSPSIDGPVPTHEFNEPATAAHELPLEEQSELDGIPVEEGFTAEVIIQESSAQIIEDTTSTVESHVSTEEISEPASADFTEVSEEVTVDEADANENAGQEASQEVEAKLAIDDVPARPWTPSYSIHSQGTPLVATKELEDVAPTSITSDVVLSAERSAENHAENAVTDDSENDTTADEQSNNTEDEVHGQTSIEVSHANPVIAFEGPKIGDENLYPQQSSQVETNPTLENELPPRPWTPKEVEQLNAESIERSTNVVPIYAQETTHSAPLTAECDKGETPHSIEQPQNNSIGEFVAAAIAPAVAIAALGARIQDLVPLPNEEAPQVDTTLTVDTTTVPLLSVPSQAVDVDTSDTIVDPPERPRSPWTPSYSVTKQGAGLSQEEEAEVDHLEPLPPTATQAATTSDSEPLLNEVQEDDSASSALQTRASYTAAGTEEIAKNEQFFLFGLRAIVAYLWVLPKWLSITPSDHSRQGSSSSSSSSSSSKFFPGGWFTPKPKEAHTSLDVAQGEFASSPKATTSNDVFETLGSEATDSPAAVNVAADDDGQKRKWCIVM